MDAMKEWTQVGPTWQRLYECGTLGLITPSWSGSKLATYRIEKGNSVSFVEQLETVDSAKAHLDKRFDPQPELCDRTEDATYYRHGKRSAIADSLNGNWYWMACGKRSVPVITRELAEAAAKSYVLGNS